MNIWIRILSYAVLLATWGVLAYMGKTPMEGFIAAVTGAIAALGANHLASPAVAAPKAEPTKDAP